MKKVKKFNYDFEKFLMEFKINNKADDILSVYVRIIKRPHKLYERKIFNTHFIQKYIEEKYGHKIIEVIRGGALVNYSSDPKKLTREYEFRIEPKVEKITYDEAVDIASKEMTDDKKEEFSNYVKNYRKHMKITQKELSEKTGLSTSKISAIENCKVMPTKEEMKVIFDSHNEKEE